MATGKVARRTAVSDVAEILDSPEVAALIGELDALRWTGRKGYGARALVGACVIKTLFALPTWTRVVALIAEHPGLQGAIGGCPSLWACYRFTEKLRAHSDKLADCFDRVSASLQDALPAYGREVAIDASDMPAFANGQRFVRRGGPLRERFSDPDASWGHRSAVSTRAAGSFYGFKIQAAVCIRTELPMVWRVETARAHESSFALPLLDAATARGFRPETAVMDKGYDTNAIHDGCEARGCAPVIPLKGKRSKQPVLAVGEPCRLAPRIARHTERFGDFYRGRGAVERTFGRLKHDYGLAPLRVRGLESVRLHADLTMLARLAQALSRARALPVTAPFRVCEPAHQAAG